MTASTVSASAAVAAPEPTRVPLRAWLVFAVSLALMLSDYMSRQVLSAVFPLLKLEWSLTDTQLGALGGVVALMVGLLTVPLSLLADRVGRARSVAAMALTWSLATLACGLCANYGQLMLARLVLGVGEAAYGSVGLAVVLTYFPRTLRATITSALMAGGVFGSFLGLTLGGVLSAHIGWRGSFAAMAAIGLVLVVAYLLVVREKRAGMANPAQEAPAPAFSPRAVISGLFSSPSIVLTYIASGLQLLVLGALMAWTPSYLNRVHGLTPQLAAAFAALLLISSGVGMVVCGALSDRLTARRPQLRSALAAGYGVATFLLLEAAFILPHGAPQIVCAVLGLFCAAGTAGPAGSLIADAAPPQLLGAALAVMTLANNLIGLAPGPAVTGALADRLGLQAALQIVTCAALLAAAAFWLSGRVRQSTQKPRPLKA